MRMGCKRLISIKCRVQRNLKRNSSLLWMRWLNARFSNGAKSFLMQGRRAFATMETLDMRPSIVDGSESTQK